MAVPTSQEIVQIGELRQRVSDLKLEGDQNSDAFLVRWIRAREGNMPEVEKMLRNSIAWRRENDIDNVASWKAPDYFLKNYNIDIVGHDKDNAPVVYFPFGSWELKETVKQKLTAEHNKYMCQKYEQLLTQLKGKTTRAGIPVTQYVMIIDSKNLAMRNMASKDVVVMLMESAKIFEANYPETLKTTYVINASRLFTMLWGILKPLLSDKTFGKFKIFSSNSKNWHEALLNEIPADQLPVFLGGTSSKTINVEAREGGTEEDDEAKTLEVQIAPGKLFQVAFAIDTTGSSLNWLLETEPNDKKIGFSVGHEGKLVVAKQNLSSNEGTVTCSKTGTYTITFENITEKPIIVKYQAYATSPDGTDLYSR